MVVSSFFSFVLWWRVAGLVRRFSGAMISAPVGRSCCRAAGCRAAGLPAVALRVLALSLRPTVPVET
jgi:hypothetical protein